MNNKSLTELFKYDCGGCGQKVRPDDNAKCPNCEDVSLLDEILNDVLSEDSKYYLVFHKTNNGKYATKIDLNRPSSSINAGACVIQVTKKFFDELVPEVHDKTPENGYCGSVVISKESPLIQLILDVLEGYAEVLDERIGKPSATNKKPDGQITFDNIFDSKEVAESAHRDWKARTKSFLDNELFVDFD